MLLNNGLLLIDKPKFISSYDAIRKMRNRFNLSRNIKIGHTGTLDPLATGLLLICVGEAVKFSQFFINLDKSYQVTAYLGRRTTTGDAAGEIIAEKPIDSLNAVKIKDILFSFQGEISQTVPIFSAVKYQGKPLYHYARNHIAIDIPPPTRNIKINKIIFNTINFYKNYIMLEFEVACSKGTYIRSLVDDLGEKLGCGAYVAELRRTNIGNFKLENLENNFYSLDNLFLKLNYLNLPTINLNHDQVKQLFQGKIVQTTYNQPIDCIQLKADKKFLGMGKINAEGKLQSMRLINNLLL